MRTLIGLFDDTNEAMNTMEELKSIGVKPGNVSVLSREGGDVGDLHLDMIDIPGIGEVGACGPMTSYITRSTAGEAPDAVASALVSLGLSREEADRYVEGVRQGHALEAVTVEDDKAPEAIRIMKQHTMGARPQTETGAAAAATTGEEGQRAVAGRGETVIPVASEELYVGKRAAETGGARVETHVEEVPVKEPIELREEHVAVERRPVNRPISEADAAEAFRDRSVEVVARTEEPVAEKRAFVVEEVAVGKEVESRTETIEDTVRKTTVDVQDLDRQHFDQTYASTGAGFDQYSPAYRFGSQIRDDRRFGGKEWSDIEPDARAAWEEKNPGTWDRFVGAVRHAW